MRAVAAVALLAVMALVSGCEKAPETSVAPVDAPHSAAAPAPNVPADQKAFIEKQALAQGLAESSAMAMCAEFQSTPSFEDWVGTVNDFRTSTVNGSIDITFDVGGVFLEQVVQKSDPLYPTIEALQMGGRTRISGRFTHGNGECGYSLRTVSVNLTQAQAF